MRRLPVYIVADCSGSMAGSPIEAVKQGIRALHSSLMNDPSAIESAYLSVITFGSTARQEIPLTELTSFVAPDLIAGGTTALGAALRLLIDCLKREVRKTTATQKGDWRPLVFLLTDGSPTDSWEDVARELKVSGQANIVAMATGDGADVGCLKEITDTVLLMQEMSPDAFSHFFHWVSVSVVQASVKVGTSGTGGISLPPPPPEIMIIP